MKKVFLTIVAAIACLSAFAQVSDAQKAATEAAKAVTAAPEAAPKVEKPQYAEGDDEALFDAVFGGVKNGSEEKVKSTITYRPVSMVLDEKNPGATQTAWIAKKPETSSNSNVNRNVLLRLETPLSYGLGSLVYTLNSATYQ